MEMRSTVCVLYLSSALFAVLLFSVLAVARQSVDQQPVDRQAFTLRKLIVEKENVRIINALSQDALTPEHIITTRSGAEYFPVHPDRPPQQISGSALGTQYLEIIWNDEANAWIEFEKLASRTGRIDTEWLYPAQDITAYVKSFPNDTVILRDRNKKPLGPLNAHIPVTVKKLDATRRYYYILLEQPLTVNGQTHTEGLVFYNSLYREPERRDAAVPESTGNETGTVDTVSLHVVEEPVESPGPIPEGPASTRRVHMEIRTILSRYVQLVDRISRYYIALYGKADVVPTFRVFQLKQITGDPASGAEIAVHLSSNASSTIPLRDSEAVLKEEIIQKVRALYPSVETVRFVVE